ncbi:MAG: MMPL family transporter [Candidatus Aramenus sp.]|nr:MMPL family transporter [Candidatus Aramenus sp.]
MYSKLLLLVPWIVLLVILVPFALNIQKDFVYSDSPFLGKEYQSVVVDYIVSQYFKLSENSSIYVIVNGTYNQSYEEVKSNLKYLQDYVLITPYEYVEQANKTYLKEVSPEVENITSSLEPLHQLYLNLSRERQLLLDNFTYFEYQLNVTYGIPTGSFHSNSSDALTFSLVYQRLLEEGYSQLDASRKAGLFVFKDPYVLLFSFSNYSNFSHAYNALSSFNNYSYLVYLLTGKPVPNEALIDPEQFAVSEIEKELPPPPISISDFHKGNEWLFIVVVPKNESLTSVEEFIQHVNGSVTGHLAIYAQSAYYTQGNLEIIDVVTVLLVGALLIALLRSLVPILLLITSAVIGVVLAYGILHILTLFGYQVYYISGLVIPPIVFGITVDYSILFVYRYFEEIRKGAKDPLKTAFKTAGRGAIFSGISITIGFASFVISSSPLLRNIGEALIVASVSSIVPAVMFNYTALMVIPQRVLGFPRREVPNPTDTRQKYLESAARYSISKKVVVVSAMLALALLSYFIFATHPSNVDVNEIVPSYSSSVRGLGQLGSLFNYSVDYVLIKGNPNSTYGEVAALAKKVISEGGLAYSPFSIGKKVLNKSEYVGGFYSHNYTLVEVYIPYPVFSQGAINLTRELINQGYMMGGSNAQRIDIVDNTVSIYYSEVLPLTIGLITLYLFLVLGSAIVPIRLSLTLLVSSLVGVAVMDAVFHSPYWLSPLIVFALLFSLGIDYDMFIILRIVEERGEEEERIVSGVKNTGLVVTTAGLILSGAFFSLVFTNMKFLQEIGFAVSFSVLFDTFVVRPIFVPAIMAVLKKYNWWPRVRRLLSS